MSQSIHKWLTFAHCIVWTVAIHLWKTNKALIQQAARICGKKLAIYADEVQKDSKYLTLERYVRFSDSDVLYPLATNGQDVLRNSLHPFRPHISVKFNHIVLHHLSQLISRKGWLRIQLNHFDYYNHKKTVCMSQWSRLKSLDAFTLSLRKIRLFSRRCWRKMLQPDWSKPQRAERHTPVAPSSSISRN